MRLRTESTEVWLKFENDAKVLARPVPMSVANQILQRHTTFESVRGVGQVEKRDFAAINQETYQYKIRDWRGMLDKDGKDLPFSKKALLEVIEHDSEFLNDIDVKLDTITKTRETRSLDLEQD